MIEAFLDCHESPGRFLGDQYEREISRDCLTRRIEVIQNLHHTT